MSEKKILFISNGIFGGGLLPQAAHWAPEAVPLHPGDCQRFQCVYCWMLEKNFRERAYRFLTK